MYSRIDIFGGEGTGFAITINDGFSNFTVFTDAIFDLLIFCHLFYNLDDIVFTKMMDCIDKFDLIDRLI